MNGKSIGTTTLTGGRKAVLGLAIFFTYVLMVFGNIVTTTGSGLACPDWPLCYGTVNPPKQISVWIEWGHRLTGAVTGVLILLSVALMWKSAGVLLKFFLKISVGFILVAVALGGLIIMVDAPLLDSAFRVGVVSSHIIVATILFVTMIIAYTGSGPRPTDSRGYHSPLFLFGIVYVQVAMGILVRYSHSTLSCPDWPLCQGCVLPPMFTPDVALHFTHRLTAYAIFLIVLWDFYRATRLKSALAAPAITFALVLAQASIGVGIVLTKMFLPLLVLHGAVGFLLLGWVAGLAAPYILPAEKTK